MFKVLLCFIFHMAEFSTHFQPSFYYVEQLLLSEIESCMILSQFMKSIEFYV